MGGSRTARSCPRVQRDPGWSAPDPLRPRGPTARRRCAGRGGNGVLRRCRRLRPPSVPRLHRDGAGVVRHLVGMEAPAVGRRHPRPGGQVAAPSRRRRRRRPRSAQGWRPANCGADPWPRSDVCPSSTKMHGQSPDPRLGCRRQCSLGEGGDGHTGQDHLGAASWPPPPSGGRRGRCRGPVVPDGTFGRPPPSPPAADSYVQSDTATTNYGTAGRLDVADSPVRRTFLRFTVSGVNGTVTSAKLRLHVDDVSDGGSPAGGTVQRLSDTTWSETAIIWKTSPPSTGPPAGGSAR